MSAEGGPYGAFVLFGQMGALVFAISVNDTADPTTASPTQPPPSAVVTFMYAAAGTSLRDVGWWVGGLLNTPSGRMPASASWLAPGYTVKTQVISATICPRVVVS